MEMNCCGCEKSDECRVLDSIGLQGAGLVRGRALLRRLEECLLLEDAKTPTFIRPDITEPLYPELLSLCHTAEWTVRTILRTNFAVKDVSRGAPAAFCACTWQLKLDILFLD